MTTRFLGSLVAKSPASCAVDNPMNLGLPAVSASNRRIAGLDAAGLESTLDVKKRSGPERKSIVYPKILRWRS